MPSNVFDVLITGDTEDNVRIAPLFGDIDTGGEAAVGNEFVFNSVVLSKISILTRRNEFIVYIYKICF